jgi:hypothetical protein
LSSLGESGFSGKLLEQAIADFRMQLSDLSRRAGLLNLKSKICNPKSQGGVLAVKSVPGALAVHSFPEESR